MTVFDNDPQLGLAIVAINETISEGELAQFQISSSITTPIPRTIEISLSQTGDFMDDTSELSTVTLQPYNSIAVLQIATDDDINDEFDGQIIASLNQESENIINTSYQSAVVFVLDNDEPEISIISTLNQDSIYEGESLNLELIADIAPINDLVVQVNIATIGDFLNERVTYIEKNLGYRWLYH